MSKFKIGDKARVLVDRPQSSIFEKGYIGKITEIYISDNSVRIDNKCAGRVNFKYIELVSRPRKHAELIHAWADGEEIQFKNHNGEWEYTGNPSFYPHQEYRIKPSEQESCEHCCKCKCHK